MNKVFWCLGISVIITAADQNPVSENNESINALQNKKCFICHQPGADVFLTPFRPSVHRACHDPIQKIERKYSSDLESNENPIYFYPSSNYKIYLEHSYAASIQRNNKVRRHHLQLMTEVQRLVAAQRFGSIKAFLDKDPGNEKLEKVFKEAFDKLVSQIKENK